AHQALLDDRGPLRPGLFASDYYARKCADVIGFLRQDVPESHPHYGACFNPLILSRCPVWICGSGTAVALAAQHGVCFSLTLFHGQEAAALGPELIQRYRSQFRPAQDASRSTAMIAICGACSDSEPACQRLEEQWRSGAGRNYRSTIVGTPGQWKR